MTYNIRVRDIIYRESGAQMNERMQAKCEDNGGQIWSKITMSEIGFGFSFMGMVAKNCGYSLYLFNFLLRFYFCGYRTCHLSHSLLLQSKFKSKSKSNPMKSFVCGTVLLLFSAFWWETAKVLGDQQFLFIFLSLVLVIVIYYI